jgi:hypothetical protein
LLQRTPAEKLGYFYYEEEPGHPVHGQDARKTRRAAANVAKLPELLRKD